MCPCQLSSQSGPTIAEDVEKDLAVSFAVVAFSPCSDDGVDGGCELDLVCCCCVAFALGW